MSMILFTHQHCAACGQLNDLAVRIRQPLDSPDLVLTQALEACRVFVPSELVSIIDTILDGYAVQAAREHLSCDLEGGYPIGVLSFPTSFDDDPERTHQ
ncbi:MAG TPA: hypothetical protein VH593_09205 [Ktedonobacteraceae bacterium]